ncbi:MFS transporter [Leptobacterium flavescens]|uniref:MFS transporter n=1 Tax=Leptobacterium flavescens TaxID=472055 RepID=A0A6P0UUG5_9FLAO|nr:MFS transporter [Leptobacterium flavescens]NER15479.1 MFS transporter [Leptobacterium flavescens]
MRERPLYILPAIIIAQFFCTSLWFAGNAVISNLIVDYQLSEKDLGHIISAVQFGFISGTLSYALLNLADRFPPSRVFFLSAVFGALANFLIVIEGQSLTTILSLRFLTGFFLAGIYPVGMKIAADYYEKGLGKALGFLVGALVLGTAFPHLLKSIGGNLPWRMVIKGTSLLCLSGGFIILGLVPDGPYRKAGKKLDLSAIYRIFKNPPFKKAAFGYFGHMWELYAFWVFVPVILTNYLKIHPEINLNIPLWSFLIIAIGGLACVIGGYISEKKGVKKTAATALLLSGICCLMSPLLLEQASLWLLIIFLLFWGMVVIADSPLFSTLVAQSASPEIKGTALTIVNCIGFSITIVSIQLLNSLINETNAHYIFVILFIGPLFGLLSLYRKSRS